MTEELKNIETLAEVCEESLMRVPGVYIFSIDGEDVAIIGRAETNVGDYLKNRYSEFKRKYNYYKIEPTYSSLEAYLLHCRLYHKHQIGVHPEPPKDRPNWACPVMGCRWEAERKTKVKISVFRKRPVLRY